MTLYDVQELSQMLQLSKGTVRRLLQEGNLTAQKIGRQWYVSETTLRDYFTENGDHH